MDGTKSKKKNRIKFAFCEVVLVDSEVSFYFTFT